MTSQRATVDTYMEGFRASDHGAILECLTDDVTWVISVDDASETQERLA